MIKLEKGKTLELNVEPVMSDDDLFEEFNDVIKTEMFHNNRSVGEATKEALLYMVKTMIAETKFDQLCEEQSEEGDGQFLLESMVVDSDTNVATIEVGVLGDYV